MLREGDMTLKPQMYTAFLVSVGRGTVDELDV
jgi:hypothetical protein